MYLILIQRVILGIDGFINDPVLGSQLRIWFFGIIMWWAAGDRNNDGNGISISLGLPFHWKVM